MLGLAINEWIMIGVIIFVVYTQLATRLTNDAVFLTAMLIILLTGVLDTDDVFRGLVSPATLFLIFMFIVVEAMQRTGALKWLMDRLLGRHDGLTSTLAKIMIPATLLSSFVSNPSVAQIMYQSVAEWGRKYKIVPSKLLLPVSYMISLGGTCTIIAYPVNLVLFSILESATGEHYGIFTPLVSGALCSLVGMASIILLQKRLPECKDPMEKIHTYEEYIVEILVPSNNNAVGKTVGELGFDNLPYGHLVSIYHYDHDVVSPVTPNNYILGGDRLVFSGNIQELIDLRDRMGFTSATHHVFNAESNKKRKLQKISLTNKSEYVGKRAIDLQIGDENNLTLVAMLREGERITTLPRETVIKAGDILLLEGDVMRIPTNDETIILHETPEFQGLTWRSIVSMLSLPLLVLLSATNVMSLVEVSFLFAIVLCGLHCCNRLQAWSSINWNFVVVLTGAFAIGLGIKESGLAHHVSMLIQMMCGTDPLRNIIIITVAAVALTQILFDATVVPILAPIAIASAASMGADPLPFMLAVLLGASCNFSTQISTAHMMMVYPVGGFRLRDLVKFGIPFCFIMAATIVLVLWALYL